MSTIFVELLYFPEAIDTVSCSISDPISLPRRSSRMEADPENAGDGLSAVSCLAIHGRELFDANVVVSMNLDGR